MLIPNTYVLSGLLHMVSQAVHCTTLGDSTKGNRSPSTHMSLLSFSLTSSGTAALSNKERCLGWEFDSLSRISHLIETFCGQVISVRCVLSRRRGRLLKMKTFFPKGLLVCLFKSCSVA